MNVHIGDKAIVNMLHKQTMAFMSLLPSLLSPAWSTSSAYVFKLCVILSLWWAFTKSALCGWGQPEAPSWNTILLYIHFFLIILNQGCEHGEVGALVWVLQGSSRQNIGLIVKNKCESKCDKGDVQWIMLMNVDPFIWLGTFKWTVNEHFGETKTNGLVPGLPTMLCPWGIDYVTGQWSVLNSPERSPWLLDHHLYHSPFSLPSQSPISLLSLDLLKSLYPLTVYISLHKSHKVCVVYVL